MRIDLRLIGLLALCLSATHPASASPDASRLDAAAAEVATKSGMPREDVDKLLADCDASQLSMNFCAWRDELAADADLTARASGAAFARCEVRVARQLSGWREHRDKICARQAAKEYGGGSAESASRAQCAASMTEDYAAHFQAPSGCSAR